MKGYQDALIGRGMAFPLTPNQMGGIQLRESEARINQSLLILFETPKGSKLMDPDFGTDVHMYRFDPLDEVLIERLEYCIRNDIGRWERRIVITEIDVKDTPDLRENNTLIISVKYKIINTNVEGNFVYPFQYGVRPLGL